MQIERINTGRKYNNFNGILNNRLLLKTVEKASDNGALLASGISLFLTTFIRPLSIMATPNVEKENKEYACAKSIASGVINFGVMFLVTKPIVDAVKNIQNNPGKFLSDKTVKILKNGTKDIKDSKSFHLISQFFKLGSSVITAVPKTFLTCALIPPAMALIFKKNNSDKDNKTSGIKSKNISFNGITPKTTVYNMMTNKLSGIFSKVFNSEKVQNFASKYSDTNIAQHLFSTSDVIATGLFMHYTSKNKHIEENRKKTLIYNAAIATGITVIGGYLVNALTKKPTEIFINKFKEVNKNLPQIEKYISGIKNVKAALILGSMYYIFTPVLATLWAEKLTNKAKVNQK